MRSNGNKKRTLILAIVMAILVVMGISSISIFANENNSSAVASVTIGSVTTEYDSFAAAVAATKGVEENCTIKLLRDTTEGEITLRNEEDINKTVTIDFGSNTLSCTKLETTTYSKVILNGTTGGVDGDIVFWGQGTINGGTYNGKDKTIFAQGIEDTTINGGTFNSENTVIYSYFVTDVNIYGGTFTGKKVIYAERGGRAFVHGGQFTQEGDEGALFCANADGYICAYAGIFDAATDISVSPDSGCRLSGGTFIGGITTKTSNLNEYLGYDRQYWIGDIPQTVTDDQKEITGGDVVVDVAPVAKVGGSYFKTLEEAVEKYNSTGNTLLLLKDVKKTLGTLEHWIELKGRGTFDLNGHTLTAKNGSSVIRITAGNEEIKIIDSSAEGTGKITGASYSIWHEGKWDAFIESGTYQNFLRIGNGTLIINGGTFENNSFGSTNDDEAKVILNGGTFKRGIQFGTGENQTVYEILGEGKTYQVGDEIWARSSVEALGDVYKFETDKSVTVVNESDAVASFTHYDNGSNTPETTLYASLSAAVAKEKSGADNDDYVTLLKDSNEDITIDNDIHMVFKGKATGVFSFIGKGNAIYLNENFPDGMKLRAKCETYPTELSTNDPIVWKVSESVTTKVSDIMAVEPGVIVQTWDEGIGLVHKHEIKYDLIDSGDSQSIIAYCDYPQSCPQGSDYTFATIKLSDVTEVYDGKMHSILFETDRGEGYEGGLPDSSDIRYYDEDGNQLNSNPVNVGEYTAQVEFGNVTAEADLVINKAVPKAEDFYRTVPVDLTYDGSVKNVFMIPVSTVSGMGDISVSYYDRLSGTIVDSPTDAGIYAVIVSVSEGDNFKSAHGITDRAWDLTIERKEIGIDWNDTVFTYDGTSKSPTATATGIVEGDQVSLIVEGANVDAGDHTAAVTDIEGPDAGNYKLPRDTETGFTIYNASQKAPDVTGVNESALGKADGMIKNVSPDMEYRREGELTHTHIDGNVLKNLETGKYYVRYKAKTNYDASLETEVIIATGRPSSDKDAGTPSSGDNSHMLIWLTLLLASGGILIRNKHA